MYHAEFARAVINKTPPLKEYVEARIILECLSGRMVRISEVGYCEAEVADVKQYLLELGYCVCQLEKVFEVYW